MEVVDRSKILLCIIAPLILKDEIVNNEENQENEIDYKSCNNEDNLKGNYNYN